MIAKSRRFNLGDLMILVAAVALATMTLRKLWQGTIVGDGASFWGVTPSRLLVAAVLSACATPLTLACLAFRVRGPRPAWRRLALRPGAVAMVACSALFAFQTAEAALSLGLPRVEFFAGTRASAIRFGESTSLVVMRSRLSNGLVGQVEPIGCFGVMTVAFTTSCGPAVAAAWLVLALAGRWRPERSWIDRLGRALGVIWIAISALAAYPVR